MFDDGSMRHNDDRNRSCLSYEPMAEWRPKEAHGDQWVDCRLSRGSERHRAPEGITGKDGVKSWN